MRDTLNKFIASKAEILNDFFDTGDVDQELAIANQDELSKSANIDSQLLVKSILAKLDHNAFVLSEDPLQRQQRINLRWRQINTMQLRKLKLDAKLKK